METWQLDKHSFSDFNSNYTFIYISFKDFIQGSWLKILSCIIIKSHFISNEGYDIKINTRYNNKRRLFNKN